MLEIWVTSMTQKSYIFVVQNWTIFSKRFIACPLNLYKIHLPPDYNAYFII